MKMETNANEMNDASEKKPIAVLGAGRLAAIIPATPGSHQPQSQVVHTHSGPVKRDCKDFFPCWFVPSG